MICIMMGMLALGWSLSDVIVSGGVIGSWVSAEGLTWKIMGVFCLSCGGS